jgi:glycosyltransferase involved in cell wall biosynthesis
MLGKYRSEYIKNMYRFINRQDRMISPSYLLGHKRSMMKILSGASMLLPNSKSEYDRLLADTGKEKKFRIIPNGIDSDIFGKELPELTREKKVLCVAQIYGMKNQHMLIEACKELGYSLEIIGKTPPNHSSYYKYCRQIADDNVRFIDFIPQEELVRHYASAEVHALPSWFETTGLTSLEAAAMGCKVVVGTGGDTKSYFGPHAWYCMPSDPGSIRDALRSAMESPHNDSLRQKVLRENTWEITAGETLSAYKEVLHGKN